MTRPTENLNNAPPLLNFFFFLTYKCLRIVLEDEEKEDEEENVIFYKFFNIINHQTTDVCCYAYLQILDVDRDGLTKLKKAVKALHASGNGK